MAFRRPDASFRIINPDDDDPEDRSLLDNDALTAVKRLSWNVKSAKRGVNKE
jgi:hypothetical protein